MILHLSITQKGALQLLKYCFITYQPERKEVLKNKGGSKLNFPQYHLDFSNQKFSEQVERKNPSSGKSADEEYITND
jgi:hypothetical protein